MSKVVFKQWMYHPNKPGTRKTVGEMLNYIATRPGVELGNFRLERELAAMPDAQKGEELYVRYIATRPGVDTGGQSHGLFGRLQGMEQMGDIADLELTRGYIENLAHDKTSIYNAVLSLKAPDAAAKGLTDRESWAELIDAHINNIARKMGIPPRTLEWVGAVHLEEGHPHLHLMYWDREQKVGVNYIDPEISNSIRKSITRDLFRDDLQAIIKQKDLIRQGLMDKVYTGPDSVLRNVKNSFAGMPLKEVYKLVSEQTRKKAPGFLNRRSAGRRLPELTRRLLELDQAIRKEYPSGALKYQYLPQSLKDRLDGLSQSILDENPQLAREYQRYLDTVRKQADMFGGSKNRNQYVDKTRRDLLGEIGNKLFTDPNIADLTSTTDHRLFDPNIRKAIYIILPDDRQTYYPLASMLVNQYYQFLAGQADERGGRLARNFEFNLDEFGNFTKIPFFEGKMTVAAGRGIHFHLYLQSREQLVAKYDRETASIILDNCHAWLYLKSNGQETLKFLEEKLGKYTVKSTSASASMNDDGALSMKINGSTSSSTQLIGRSLLTADEIGGLERPYLLVVADARPALLQIPDLHKWEFNTMLGLGDEEHNTQLRMLREHGRPEHSIAPFQLWDFQRYFTRLVLELFDDAGVDKTPEPGMDILRQIQDNLVDVSDSF